MNPDQALATSAAMLAAEPKQRPAPTSARGRSALHADLDQIKDCPPEYGQQLSSHLPMALHALHQLGASEAQIHEFIAAYSARFQGQAPAQRGALLSDWRQALGQFDAFADLRLSFELELARLGRDAVLARALPVLLPGVSAVAFHGLIRTAHAVEGGHESELAAALAYWACRWQNLPPPPPPTSEPGQDLDVAAWSQALVDGARGWRSEAPLIFLRMQAASATPVYAELAHRLKPEAEISQRVAQLASLALGYYLDSGNFTVLHMITGLRALRVLLPWLPQAMHSDPALQRLLDQAFVAAYLAGRVQPRPPPGEASPGLPWPALAAAACRSRDDHAIKLVHACGDEMAVYGDTRYLQAAALVLREG